MTDYTETNYERLPNSAVPPTLRHRIECLRSAVEAIQQVIPEQPVTEPVNPVEVPYAPDNTIEVGVPATPLAPIGHEVSVVPAGVEEAMAAVRQAFADQMEGAA